MQYVFDLESNGLLDSLTKIHCLVLKEIDSGKVHSFTPNKVEEGLKLLSEADLISGHNIIGFDLPAIKKVFPQWSTKAKILDTIICSRLIWSNVKDNDYKNYQTHGFNPKLIGSHSLKAWGVRLNLHKDNFGETSNWAEWSEDMQAYCEKDVEVNYKFYQLIKSKNYSQQALDLEHDFAQVIHMQEKQGFCFDKQAAEKLLTDLIKKRLDLEEELQLAFPAWTKDLGEFIPAKNNKIRGYIKGVAINKYETVTFNPNSRYHIADRLKYKYNWKPKVFTPDGKPQVDEAVLKTLKYPEAEILAEYLLIQKRISQLAEGNSAWLKVEKKNKIYGSVITLGTATRRCSHVKPNLGQVPAVGSPYGKECRSLFIVPPSYKLCGVDFSGLELRGLSHYMAAYDNGAYVKQVVDGDVHTFNQKAAGLKTRATAKTMIYALIYGCGDRKMGEIIGGTSKDGKRMKEKLFNQLPALASLSRDVKHKAERTGVLKSIDGGNLNVRSSHSALNFLIQSCGSILVKQATILLNQILFEKYEHGKDYAMVCHVHDEMQFQVREEIAEDVGRIAVKTIQDTANIFNFRCPLDAEFKIGNNWAETH